jgi:hypothetical protein
MATFISTVLTQRTGATTKTFTPTGISNGIGTFRDASATYSWLGSFLTARQSNQGNRRLTSVRVTVPQLDADGLQVLSRPYGQIELYIPEGTLQTDVNDIVGYLNALSATSLTNFDDIFVDGSGVF